MIPGSRRSTVSFGDQFLGARNATDIGRLLDREDGGVALQDPSQGLVAKQWLGKCDGTTITLSAPGVPATVVITDDDITEFSFSFDQNMNVAVSYRAGGITKLNWYDLQENGQVTTIFGSDYMNPRVALDDKHRLASDTSDVIFAYLRSGDLYVRQQRDRYEVEYLMATAAELLAEGITGPLKKVGMGIQNRFQFAFEE